MRGEPITFFEITTAAAFLAFSRTPADYLILEVGLGGRLDATNVIDHPAVSIITTIDYDHQQYLGDTLSLIAHEKAGILKRGCPAIVGAQPDEARAEIERVAERVRSPAGDRRSGLAGLRAAWPPGVPGRERPARPAAAAAEGPPPDRQCRQRHRRHPHTE